MGLNWTSGVVGAIIGIVIGGTAIHVFRSGQLASEQAAHARESETNARKLAAISYSAAKAANEAIATHNAAAARIAALDQQYHQERISHEADNARNRVAIANGARRLRIEVSRSERANGDRTAAQSPTSGGMGDGTRRYAELSPEVGKDIFGIVDDADNDARMKASYLQRYIDMLRRRGVIAEPASKPEVQ